MYNFQIKLLVINYLGHRWLINDFWIKALFLENH